jgi:hypothetical protein
MDKKLVFVVWDMGMKFVSVNPSASASTTPAL